MLRPLGRSVPVWLEQNGQVGETEEVRAGAGQVRQGLVNGGEDLGFYPEGGGGPEGWWAEQEQDLTLVLTGALQWLLPGGQTRENRQDLIQTFTRALWWLLWGGQTGGEGESGGPGRRAEQEWELMGPGTK